MRVDRRRSIVGFYRAVCGCSAESREIPGATCNRTTRPPHSRTSCTHRTARCGARALRPPVPPRRPANRRPSLDRRTERQERKTSRAAERLILPFGLVSRAFAQTGPQTPQPRWGRLHNKCGERKVLIRTVFTGKDHPACRNDYVAGLSRFRDVQGRQPGRPTRHSIGAPVLRPSVSPAPPAHAG